MYKRDEGLDTSNLPMMYRVRQHFESEQVEDIESEIINQLNRAAVKDQVKPGQNIAVCVGSRGVTDLARITKAVVTQLIEWDCKPFIVPAMGSHGNSIAENQTKILHEYGIDESTMGVPVRSSMEVVELGTVELQLGKDKDNVPVYLDKNAYQADGIVLIHRVKPHTDFNGDIESGLMKMMVIGLGKQKGATAVHARGVEGLRALIPIVGRHVLQKAPVSFGLAIVENAYDHPCRLQCLLPGEIEEEEKKLLALAKKNMPSFPVDEFDLLIVDEIGKNISGTGMDPNVIGRIGIWGVPEPDRPKINKIVVLGLSEQTLGSAVGLGLADAVPKRVVDKVDFGSTYTNVLAGNCFQRAFTPVVTPNDSEAIIIGIAYSRGWDSVNAKVIRIKNTLMMQEIEVSESIWREIKEKAGIKKIDGPYPFKFDADGFLLG